MADQEMQNNISPLGKLFAMYYIYVKKQKRDINYQKEFDAEELDDLAYTILLFLNHIGTDLEQNCLTSEEIARNTKNIVVDEEISCAVSEVVAESK